MCDFFDCHRCRMQFKIEYLIHHTSGKNICEYCWDELQEGLPIDKDWEEFVGKNEKEEWRKLWK